MNIIELVNYIAVVFSGGKFRIVDTNFNIKKMTFTIITQPKQVIWG